MSLWGLWFEFPLETYRELTPRAHLLVRQGLGGALAIVLAVLVGRFSLHRFFLRFWYVFPALFAVMLVAAPLSVWAGSDCMVKGMHWWQGSSSIAVSLLALISGLCFALPRFRNGSWSGLMGMAGAAAFCMMVPSIFLVRLGEHIVFSGVLFWSVLMVLNGKRRLFSAMGTVLLCWIPFCVMLFTAQERMSRVVSFLNFERNANTTAWQLVQSFSTIYAGGWTGIKEYPPLIPEWQTDFMFARLCGIGGLAAGLAGLLLVAVLAVLAWRIVARLNDPAERTLGACCAVALTLYPLTNLLVVTGLFPTTGIIFPFLSYGFKMMLCHGFLLGLLISLGRTKSDSPTGRIRWVVFAAAGLALIGIAFRLVVLVVDPPSPIRDCRVRELERIKQRLAEKNKPVRGSILDCNGRVLAQTSESYIVCADPGWMTDAEDQTLLPELARLIGMEHQAILDRTSDTSRRYVRLKKNLPAETAEAVKRLAIKGIFTQALPDRRYPFAVPLAHLVGFVQTHDDLIGSGGVELMQDRQLRTGHDVPLTLDIHLQAAVQKIAEAAANETQAKQIQIIVMNPQTGAIRAAAQVPAAHGEDSPTSDPVSLLWRVVIDVLEPGGLLWPLVIASALDSGAVTPDTRIDCENGQWVYAGHPLHDAKPLGVLTPKDILNRSSNIGMAKIGLQMGKQSLYDSLISWGLSEKCSVGGFGGATSGLLYPPKRWSELEITRIPLGHSCSFTLLQIIRAYTALFNNGQMVEPCITGSSSESKFMVKPETAQWIREAMTQAVENGTGQSARIEGLSIAGKTSVAQKMTPDNRGYSTTAVQTGFIGGFETEGSPWLIAVWLDEPNRKESFNPAPGIFRTVATEVMNYEN